MLVRVSRIRWEGGSGVLMNEGGMGAQTGGETNDKTTQEAHPSWATHALILSVFLYPPLFFKL